MWPLRYANIAVAEEEEEEQVMEAGKILDKVLRVRLVRGWHGQVGRWGTPGLRVAADTSRRSHGRLDPCPFDWRICTLHVRYTSKGRDPQLPYLINSPRQIARWRGWGVLPGSVGSFSDIAG